MPTDPTNTPIVNALPDRPLSIGQLMEISERMKGTFIPTILYEDPSGAGVVAALHASPDASTFTLLGYDPREHHWKKLSVDTDRADPIGKPVKEARDWLIEIFPEASHPNLTPVEWDELMEHGF